MSTAMRDRKSALGSDTNLVGEIEASVRQNTWGRVSNLKVEWLGEMIIIHGGAPSYYVKQLALEATRKMLPPSCLLRVDIGVVSQ